MLNPTDPTRATLSIAHDADAGGYGTRTAIHQLDNVESTARSVFIQEDTGGHNQGMTVLPDLALRHRHWRDRGRSPRSTRSLVPASPQGAWESSGIVDVSDVFGKDMFLADVQAGTLIVDEEVRGTLTYQREGGQLLLVKIPGA